MWDSPRRKGRQSSRQSRVQVIRTSEGKVLNKQTKSKEVTSGLKKHSK